MDFEKIKPAVEEIQLSDIQKEEIINACKGKKRKFNYKPLAVAAAAAVIVIAVFSPGFLLRAGSDLSAEVADEEDYYYFADSYNNMADSADTIVNQSASGTGVTHKIFESNEHRELYCVIPAEFSSLVDYQTFEEWKADINPDDGAAIFQFIKHFAVSREEFENANKKFAERLCRTYGKAPVTYPDENSEHLEIFNTEIIFSLDKKKISDYYLCSEYTDLKSPVVTVFSDYYQ